MLAVASKRFATLSSVLRTCSTFRGFAEAVNSDEFEIVKNMSTYPLFSEKVQYQGSKETNLKYFRGSDWIKTSDKLIFNPDAEALADKIPGKVDENLCLHVSAPFEERSLLPSTKGFDAVKANVDSFLASQPNVYVQDGKLGTTPRSCVHVRSVTNDPIVALALKALTFPVTDVKSKEGNEYRNNLTIYVARGNNSLEECVNSHLVSNHTYTLVINGSCSLRQMIDEIADAANKLFYHNNRDLADLTTGEASAKDTINTVVVPCSCLRAKNNVSTFLFSDCTDFNHISHKHLDEIHRNAFNTGSLFSLDHTVISNNIVNGLFGGVQLSNRIGSLIPPTESVFINDSILTSTMNDKTCTLPSTLVFIQNATGMKELNYGDLRKLVKTWTQPDDMSEYLLAWTKLYDYEGCDYRDGIY
ncbi:hypothetical protein WA171_002637 [Blastocystis sp. BT1]